MDFLHSLFQHNFLQNAVLAGILASIACGFTGTFVVIKKINFISGGIAHTVLGGVGIAYFLGLPPILGAFVAAFISAVIIGLVKLHAGQHEDTVISALWAVGMAVGIIFMYLTPGYSIDLLTYLFGNILMVSHNDIIILIVLNLFVIISFFIFYRQFVSISFDEEFSQVRGLPVNFLNIFLLVLIAFTIVVLIRIVGLILVIALLTLPAAISSLFMKTPARIIALSMFIGVLFTFSGIAISYEPNIPAGATIIVISGISYILALLLKKFYHKRFLN
jgi:zinc transport system permease protein